MGQGYATQQVNDQNSNVPRFGGAINHPTNKQRLATGNDKESRMRANNALAPITGGLNTAPGTAKTDGRNVNSTRNNQFTNQGLGQTS